MTKQQKKMPVIRFDNALPAFIALARDHFGQDALDRNLVLRDAIGRLTLVLRSKVDNKTRASFNTVAEERLGAYVDGPSATPDELFDSSLETDDEVIIEHVESEGAKFEVRLVDRRIVGQDWNRPDFTRAAPDTPIVAFFSCKGGVGRSTALAVAAAALSDRGKSVLIVDLDLEAPGLGQILLPPDNMPEYGALDYFVENGLGGVDDNFLEACIGTSPLTAGRGLVEVVPAVGKVGLANPQNVLPKLGRAFLDDPDGEGGSLSFRDQTRILVRELAARDRSDVIFIDARAGLSESAAASVLGLGGEVLMFGVDTPQTFESYKYLLAHLGRFATQADQEGDWRHRLRMVHAKAARGPEAWARFRDRAQEVFATHLYEEASPDDIDAFNFDIDDPDAPHYAWPIPYDAEYAEFDPVARREQLARDFFDRSFGFFVKSLFATIFPEEARNGD